MKTLCRLRDIYRSAAEFEQNFENKYGLCLNEGMLLCTLKDSQLSSSEIALSLGLTNSNTSKVIKSVEDKGLICRSLGNKDKRQMYFSLTPQGQLLLTQMNCQDVEIPIILKEIIDK